MSHGYVYCMSNPAMPGILKVGFTERTIDERLQEANNSTWLPLPFSVEFAKFVKEPNHKEQIVHQILGIQRVNPKREFFRTTTDIVKPLFELMDGPWWDSEDFTDTDSRVLGDEVIRQFLNKHIYPGNEESQPVSWSVVTASFQAWKRENGFTQGSAIKLREELIHTFGKPNRGEGWSQFSLRTAVKPT